MSKPVKNVFDKSPTSFSYLRFNGLKFRAQWDESVNAEVLEIEVPTYPLPNEINDSLAKVGLSPSQREEIIVQVHEMTVMNMLLEHKVSY